MRTQAVLAALTLAAAVVVAPPATAAPADAKVVPIQVTGDPAKRFNLVVLGDGYTTADMPKFREHVDKHLNVLWTIEPFKSYRSYVNVYAVEITSAESGVDCDPGLDSGEKDTALGMGFWGGCNPSSVQRLLTVNGTAANTYADLVPGTTRGNRQLLALGNSDTYGGAGGANATASGGNALSALITPHELGHSLGGLQDEYDYYARGERGEPYEGGEPDSSHHTLLTEQEMLAQQKKWWRWLGEESESGGPVGRYEGGMYAGTGVWRSSAHSMMKTLGYYFDQIAREQMTQRISAKTNILQDGVPASAPVGADRVLWVETMYPVSHQLDVTWTLDGAPVARGTRNLDLSTVDLSSGVHSVTATVVDPTEFVRDPAIRASAALTRSRTWTVDTSLHTPVVPVEPAFTLSTPTTHPVGATDVVYAEVTHPTDTVHGITWRLDGRQVDPGVNDRAFDLEPLGLTGTHTLTATAGAQTRTWTVDGRDPSVTYALSEPLLSGNGSYVFNGPFTMDLEGGDDTPGYVVREFRTDGDGWFNYFGWPTDPDAPFLFTPQGTEIDSLVYGKLGVPRLSPWDQVPTSYGTHRIDYRSIDPAGNIGTASSFDVTLLPPPPACTTTVTGRHSGPLTVRDGVTCLNGATVTGPVTVLPGASLVATAATVSGPISATRAAVLELFGSTVGGPLTVTGASSDVQILGGTVNGPVTLTGNAAPVLAGATVHGPLSCVGNAAAPDDLSIANRVGGPSVGQCR
ncbi:M64 family metallopeptidase [Actinophytocola oryzae]|uniref:IgA peptidase M64 n=1 Tax=Actinophytocola oryzae TaxID=502181 RepID=A0A4R7VQS6_9PSEU|nr:M64 family metallopeptidase [Actinophytocola oryzae]TDV52113.1 IgA peptidase M64 [Actinophytocola oryzae]